MNSHAGMAGQGFHWSILLTKAQAAPIALHDGREGGKLVEFSGGSGLI